MKHIHSITNQSPAEAQAVDSKLAGKLWGLFVAQLPPELQSLLGLAGILSNLAALKANSPDARFAGP